MIRPLVPLLALIGVSAPAPDTSLPVVPRKVTVWLSEDGAAWREAASIEHDIPPEREDAFVYRFGQVLPPGSRERCAKVRAEHAGPLPAWHLGAGGKAWIFVDEIAVR